MKGNIGCFWRVSYYIFNFVIINLCCISIWLVCGFFVYIFGIGGYDGFINFYIVGIYFVMDFCYV